TNQEDALRELLVFLDLFRAARRWRWLRCRRSCLAIPLALDQRLHRDCEDVVLAVGGDCRSCRHAWSQAAAQLVSDIGEPDHDLEVLGLLRSGNCSLGDRLT